MSTVILPPEIQELFASLLPSFTFHYKGKPVNFILARHEHTYLYFTGKNGTWHCYTPHPSTDGDYFVFDYVPKGKGSRSGSASRYVMKNVVRCAHRKTAKAKAIARAGK